MAFILRSFFTISLTAFAFSAFADYETHRMNAIDLPNTAEQRNDLSKTSGPNPTSDYKGYNSSSDYNDLSKTHERKKIEKKHMFNPAAAIKKASSNTKGKPKHNFYDEAAEYTNLAQEYRQKGMDNVAQDYDRLSAIKLQAAKLADEEKWDQISWDEFNKIEEGINAKIISHK